MPGSVLSRSKTALGCWTAAAVLVLILFFTRLSFNFPHDLHPGFLGIAESDATAEPSNRPGPPECTVNLSGLEELGLTSEIQYARREIYPRQTTQYSRKGISDIEENLFPESQIASIQDVNTSLLHCEQAIVLESPSVNTELNAGRLILGVATSLGRLRDSMPQLLHWLPRSGIKLLVTTFAEESEAGIQEIEEEMQALDMDVTFQRSDQPFQLAYFSMVERLHTLRNESTRWIGLIDDDTFFPSASRLLLHLADYDDTRPCFLSSISEDISQIKKHGLIAFGGGGTFLSLPLVEQLIEVYSECANNTWIIEGDQVLSHCVYTYTATRLTVDWELHQLDLRGRTDGFFESGREPISIHHWKSYYKADIPQMASVTQSCGERCFLQRWKSSDDMILSNGFSVARYPKGINFNPGYVEKTWDWEDDRFAHSIGPLRPMLAEEDKITHMIARTVREERGMRQTYVRRGVDGEMDSVLELIWLF